MNRTIKFDGTELQLICQDGSRDTGDAGVTFASNDGSVVKIVRFKYWSWRELNVNFIFLTVGDLEEISDMVGQPAGIWQLPALNVQSVLQGAYALKNDYEIRGDITAIFLDRRDGSTLETMVDTDDLPLLNEFLGKWGPIWCPSTNSCYVRFHICSNKKWKQTLLHRWVLQAPDGMDVDHINHDTLDNRKSNLRIVTRAENMQNRKGATKDSKSGIRGVSWHKKSKKWVANLQLKGSVMRLGSFEDIEEAKCAVKLARAAWMPFSEEAKEKA